MRACSTLKGAAALLMWTDCHSKHQDLSQTAEWLKHYGCWLVSLPLASIYVRICKLKIEPISVEPEPDAANQAAKDQLNNIVRPCNVEVILSRTADQETNAPPQLPSIDPEWKAFHFSHGQGKVACTHQKLP